MSEHRTLRSGFLRSLERAPERTALELEGRALSYAELHDKAAALAATLDREARPGPRRTACWGHRSTTGYAAVLAALYRGHSYVPLHPEAPPARTRSMLERSGCGSIVVAPEAVASLVEVLSDIEGPRTALLPDAPDVTALRAALPQHTVLGAADLSEAGAWIPGAVELEEECDLLFTSGSTGRPKGVRVAHSNVLHFIDAMVARYDLGPTDRFSQMFDLVFDLHGFDLWVAWEVGATVCCPGPEDLLVPVDWIRDAALTVWFSVPSVAVLLKRMRVLRPDLFGDLRYALFCGEALRGDIAAAWAAAAPSALIENLYGPTEVTLCCTGYRWDQARSPAACVDGIAPIGTAFDGLRTLVVDDELRPVAPGEVGELLVAGPQVTLGYLDPERTAAAFVDVPGQGQRWYRTGDRVREGESLTWVGRSDGQVKIRGHRVELGEVEAALRGIDGVEEAVAVPWPQTASGADGLVAFVSPEADPEHIREHVARELPAYMCPRRVIALSELPHTLNGKLDRRALEAHLRR